MAKRFPRPRTLVYAVCLITALMATTPALATSTYTMRLYGDAKCIGLYAPSSLTIWTPTGGNQVAALGPARANLNRPYEVRIPRIPRGGSTYVNWSITCPGNFGGGKRTGQMQGLSGTAIRRNICGNSWVGPCL